MALSFAISSLWSQEEQMRYKDARARLTSCTLRNMRTVKCHGWERAFLERVLRVRGQELGALRTSGLLFSVSLVSFQVSTFLVSSPWSPSQQSGDWGTACWGRGHEVGGVPELCSPSLQTTPSIHQTAAFLDPARSQGFLLSAELASQLHHCPDSGSGW